MQFLGRLFVPEQGKLVLIFMCQNDPGGCEEWDANSGANVALVVDSAALTAVSPPEEAELVRPEIYGAKVESAEPDDYEEARERWAERSGRTLDHVVGQYLGEAPWLQNDETPNCSCCDLPMQFLALMEEGPNSLEQTMNFGGGRAYLFICSHTLQTAKFLWQC